jgi:hypothetical protein
MCDQNDPDSISPKCPLVEYFVKEMYLVIVIIWLLLSVYICPKVITISGFNCSGFISLQ